MAAGDISTRNPLSDVQNILNIFKGSAPTTTSSTSTENVSTDKANAYLKSILESNSGLASVSSGQKAAGMYSSTVNQQLTNDLLSRTAAQTAALSTSKTTTQSQKTAPQLDLAKTLMGLGAGQVLTPVAKAGTKKLGLDDLGNDISNAIFGSPTADASGAATPIDTSGFDNLNTFLKSDASGSSAASSESGSSSSGASSMLAATGVSAAGAALASAGSDAAITAGLADASYAIGGTGAFMAADAGATAATAAATAATATEGAGVLDTIATAAAAAWIVCTELNKQGRLPYRYYIYGAREFAKYDERGKQGYYIWAIPSVKYLRAYPNSFYSRTLEVVFNARAEYLAAKAGCKGARKTTLGAVTTHGLYAFCWVLSRTIARKSYSQEQILGAGA